MADNDELNAEPVPIDERNATVAVFGRHDQADAAVRLLRDGGVDPAHVAVIGRGLHSEDRVVGFYNSGTQMKHWGSFGALWGGVWGWLLFGFFWVPGIGHLTAAGWIVANLASAASGAAIGGGIGVVAAALRGVGIPDDAIPEYESVLKADQYLVVVHGTESDVTVAKQILDDSEARQVDLHASVPASA